MLSFYNFDIVNSGDVLPFFFFFFNIKFLAWATVALYNSALSKSLLYAFNISVGDWVLVDFIKALLIFRPTT